MQNVFVDYNLFKFASLFEYYAIMNDYTVIKERKRAKYKPDITKTN